MSGFPSHDQKKFVEIGLARHRSEVNDTMFDEPLAILAACNWLDHNPEFSFFHSLERDIDKHTPRNNGFECYLAFYVRLVFAGGQRLNSIFPFRSDFAKRNDLAWQRDEFELVTVVATKEKNQPLVCVVTPSSGPSSNFGFLANTGDKVNEWITQNKERFAFCFPPESFGPDVLWFMRHKPSGRLLLCASQAKKYEKLGLGVLREGVRSLSPPWFWKSKDSKVCLLTV
jgi:hypothetical protein